MLMDWLKKAPTAVIVLFGVMATTITLGVLVTYLVLALQGDPADLVDFRQWIQTVGIALVLPLLGVNTVATWAGGRAASRAEDNTNGTLTAKEAEINAMRSRIAELEQRLTERAP